jgi:membrane protein implicated in regulation of membrane protease activity
MIRLFHQQDESFMNRNPGRGRPDARTLLKYALAQIPDIVIFVVVVLVLQRWLDLSAWIATLLIALWVLKDILLFPLLRRSFEEGRPEDAQPMIGARGLAKERIDPDGYAWIQGELWRAQLVEGHPSIEAGEPVKVENIRGLTLLVASDPEARRS